MASPNLLTSITAIESWFAAKITTTRAQFFTFQRCSTCRLSCEECDSCSRSLEILRDDIEQLANLAAREINLYNNRRDDILGDGSGTRMNGRWSNLDEIVTYYAEKEVELSREINELEEVDARLGLGVLGKMMLKNLRWDLEDLEREERWEVEIARAKGWVEIAGV
jgi:hypothetical protein